MGTTKEVKKPKRRIMLIVAYDGTDYCGWQIQANGVSIEEVLTGAVEKVTGVRTIVYGASRTDAGVHALGNVAVFDTTCTIEGDMFARAVNTYLPDDIRVRASCEVPAGFHPRYGEILSDPVTIEGADGPKRPKAIKTYEYYVMNTTDIIPTERRTHWYLSYPLDLDQMRRAAKYLIGEHDFTSFCCPRTGVATRVRELTKIDITQEGDLIIFHIEGSGFLMHMVRIIVGTLVRVGRGYYRPSRVLEILEAKDREEAGPTAPAHGLFLIGIDYPVFSTENTQQEDR